MGATRPFLAPAYAKVNLALGVAPPEPAGTPRAGWHRICSWMAAIDLCDDVELTPQEPGPRDGEPRVLEGPARFVLDVGWAADAPRPSPLDWASERDLCVRALIALDRVLTPRGVRVPPVRVSVRKRIPIGGGLGGGSSDAATTLRLARDLMGMASGGEPSNPLDVCPGELRLAARAIGSDVEFFLDDACATHAPPRPSIVSGFGDEIERLAPVDLRLVLLFPEVGCPTREVYRAFDDAPRPLREARVRALAGLRDAGSIAQSVFNDLAEPAVRAVPGFGAALARARAALAAPVHVSGSGSTMFLIARDEAEQRNLLAAAGALAPGIVAWPARTR